MRGASDYDDALLAERGDAAHRSLAAGDAGAVDDETGGVCLGGEAVGFGVSVLWMEFRDGGGNEGFCGRVWGGSD